MRSFLSQQASQHSPIIAAMSANKPNEVLRLLQDRLATIGDVKAAKSTLIWDRQTYMPEGGIAGRAEQLATLSRLVHETLISRETAELMAAQKQAEFTQRVVSDFGYDWKRGRLDRVVHPFCISLGNLGI